MLNPILFSTGSENFIEGLGISLAGLLIVFAVLILICGILYLFGHLFYKKPEAAPAEVKPAEAEEAVVQESVVEEATDDEELVAAITAAISCCLGRSADRFIVRSFRRIGRKRGR